MSIASDIIRGHTDAIILARLLLKDSYGYEINKAILRSTDQEFELKEATLYSAFKRLEELALIRSYWGDETTGARRKYYAITDKGKEEYYKMKKDWLYARQIIDKLLSSEDIYEE